MVRKKHLAAAILALILGLSLVLPQSTWAMDNYTHDADIARDNTVVDSSFNGIMYNNQPYYVVIPRYNGHRQYSNTTPVVVGSELYQYTYDDYGKGYLTQIDLTKPQSGWTLGGGASLNETLIATFDEGFSGANGEVNNAAGVSGPTVTKDWTAIAVGKYLYWWPTGNPGQTQYSPIRGNSGNDISLIAASPLITPPLTANGTDMITLQTVTWQTPFAIVGSWSGGVISQPLYTPSNVALTNYSYLTTQDATNATNDIVTSSPAWDPATTAVGAQGAAVFGVDAYQSGKNRLILMDPTSGNYKSIYTDQNGSPIFYGPIDSSPAIVDTSKFPSAPVANGTIIVPDQGAAIYELSADGRYMADNTTAMDQSNPTIANVAFDGKNVIWVGNGHTTLNAVPITMFGASQQAGGPNYVGLNSPAVVNNGSSDTVFLASTGQDGLMVTNPMTVDSVPAAFGSSASQNTWQTLGSVSPAYTSVAADVGTDSTDGSQLHDIATWTDAGYNAQGAVELWTSTENGYTIQVSAAPPVVNSGDKVYVTAVPNPDGVTKSMQISLTGGGNTWNGSLVQWNRPPNENWLAIVTAPSNYTGKEVVYTATITATSTTGQTATGKAAFTVEPIPLPPPGNLSGTLNIVARRLNGATQPQGQAKYGDLLEVTLNVATPPPPSGLLNAVVTGARITKAWVDTPRGHVNTADSNLDIPIIRSKAEINMTLNGLTATTQYNEDWAGYPPPIPDNTVMETDYIDAPFAVHVDYKYEVPDGNGGYYWQTGSYDASGNASTSLDITGTEGYGYDVPESNNNGPVWEP